MDRKTILEGIHEIFFEILPKYDPAPVSEETLVINVSTEVDSLTINELILGLEDRFEILVGEGTVRSETKISDVIDFVIQSRS